MRVRTDDEIYRIDAVWLGPPRATFPWRATYASYALGFLVCLVVLFVQRRIGIPFGIFSTAWALVITVFLVRVISRKVNYEKGVVHLFEHFWHEVTGPRERTDRRRVALSDSRVRVRKEPATRSGRNRSAGRARTQTAARAAAGSTARGSAASANSWARSGGRGGRTGAGAGADSMGKRPAKRPSRSPKPHPLRDGGR